MLLEEYSKLGHIKKKLQKLMINMAQKIFFQKLKYVSKNFSSPTFQVKPLNKSPISLAEKLELSHKMAPLKIY